MAAGPNGSASSLTLAVALLGVPAVLPPVFLPRVIYSPLEPYILTAIPMKLSQAIASTNALLATTGT